MSSPTGLRLGPLGRPLSVQAPHPHLNCDSGTNFHILPSLAMQRLKHLTSTPPPYTNNPHSWPLDINLPGTLC